jgi:chromobox protein 1
MHLFITVGMRITNIFLKGVLRFQVKWEGYNKKSDLTWEPEENL